MTLLGRTALVTGSSRGIGSAIARVLGAEGADVAVHYVKNREAAESVAADVTAHGRKTGVFQADLGVKADCERLAAEVLDHFGSVDILINNAAVGSQSINYPLVTEAATSDIELLMNVNMWGPFHLCRLLAPQMRTAARGDIVMISSGASTNARPRMLGYTASKAAMEALAHTLALEERPHGTRVNIIAPGLVQTDMGVGAIRQFLGTDDLEEVAATMPFGIICQPDDIAQAVKFLCGEAGRYVTNQRIAVDGGGT